MTIKLGLPPARSPPAWDVAPVGAGPVEGSLERPGYRAIAYPRPKTVSGEDRVMPGAVAVRPKDGQVFVASMKTGELFALRDPTGDGKNARFDNYARGLFQDAFSMLAEDDAPVRPAPPQPDQDHRHRRRRRGRPLRPRGRPAARRRRHLRHGLRPGPRQGRRASSSATPLRQHDDARLAAASLRLQPGKPPEEVAYGMRNPLGWCAGPDGEVFFTDNQGDWVATNKLCHVAEGRFYGWPNPAQKQHATKPAGKAAVWVPYGWARSINGVAYDNTGGKFGPFAGQFFMAELMFGGAIIRANVEKVNGVYQGACFPFWGKGLLGPLTWRSTRRASCTSAGSPSRGGWPSRTAGPCSASTTPARCRSRCRSIHVRPRGFRLVFTAPVDRRDRGRPGVVPAGALSLRVHRGVRLAGAGPHAR